ncbi:MAG: hypothetical protein JNM88_12650 [Chitinophagaceae bacterium]|nr:hypothetical protein [Chitinophagaceae bacterium]
MKTLHSGSHPILSQTIKNTTLWVGHLQSDPNDHLAGQTFRCPADGQLNNIQVYSAAVTQEGEVVLTLHAFGQAPGDWGPAIGESRLTIEKKDIAHWISFDLPPVPLQKGQLYGFRLRSEKALVGIGEAVSHAHRPFDFGQAWTAHSENGRGHFYNYFSLAFKVELCA